MEFQTAGHGYHSKEDRCQIPQSTYIYRLLHKWGFAPKVPMKRFVRTASKEEKTSFKEFKTSSDCP